ncbi:DNA polymerase III subunit delta [Thermodesulfobacteriota bacterium]
MPIISYKDLSKYLEDRGSDPFLPVYLICGEELLVQGAFDELLNALIPASRRSINYDPLDGIQANVHEVIERVNTFSLLPGTKVIALRDSRIFHARQDKEQLLGNARQACKDNNFKKAAGHLLSVMGLLNLTFDDIDHANRSKSLGPGYASGEDNRWLDETITYCRENNLSVPAARDDSRTLQLAIEKGFPRDNHLIITTGVVDKRRSLYKTLSTEGMIIDCSVPKGDRRADRIAQEAVLAERKDAILGAVQKTMSQAAYHALYEKTGFDLRTFSSSLEKLVNYSGDRREISIEDVESVLPRTKIDPIYELTNALADRSPEQTLFFLDSILSSDFHPLQAFAAMINQIRKLLLVKDFVESPYGRDWQAACPYDYFQRHVIPAVIEYDRELLDQLDSWQTMLTEEADPQHSEAPVKKKKKASKTASDLLIAKNPKNPYPIYLLFKKSERYTKEELLEAFDSLNEADKQLKSSGQNPKLVLEKVVLDICGTQVRGPLRAAHGMRKG